MPCGSCRRDERVEDALVIGTRQGFISPGWISTPADEFEKLAWCRRLHSPCLTAGRSPPDLLVFWIEADSDWAEVTAKRVETAQARACEICDQGLGFVCGLDVGEEGQGAAALSRGQATSWGFRPPWVAARLMSWAAPRTWSM